MRAPDPTILADGRVTVMLRHLEDANGAPVPLFEAHRWDYDPSHGVPVSDCGAWVLDLFLPSEAAAYVAVPCRRCWPDAPPPGHVWSQYVLGRVEPAVAPFLVATPGLAWQIEVSNRGGDTAPEQTAGGKPPTKLGDRGGRGAGPYGTRPDTAAAVTTASVRERTAATPTTHVAGRIRQTLERLPDAEILPVGRDLLTALADVAEAAARTEIVEHGPIVSVAGWPDLQRTLARLDEVAR